MPINSGTTFDTVVISCLCGSGEFLDHWVQQGTTLPRPVSGWEWIPGQGMFDVNNAEVQEVIRRVKAGTATVYYFDDSADPDVLYAVLSAPLPFWQFHDRHPFWADDSHKISDRLATKGKLVEEGGNRHIEFEGGFVPVRPDPSGSTIEHPLNEWSVSRINANQINFRLVIPASAERTLADIHQYHDVAAIRDWLNDHRSAGDALPESFISTGATAFAGRQFRIPVTASDLSIRRATFTHLTTSFTRTATTPNYFIVLNLAFSYTPDQGYINSAILTDGIAEALAISTGTIPAVGNTVEPPFGSRDVTAHARKLESNDGNVFMAGGIVLAQWKDPGSETQRIMPLVGFGRSIDYADLAPRIGGGKWAPRPEERPRVDLVHFNETNDGLIAFEPATSFVAYAGTDRTIHIHNKSAANTLTVFFEKVLGTPQTILVLRPGERMSVRVALDITGADEYAVVAAPPRYQVRGGSYFNVTSNYYDWSVGGVDFRFRPWFSDVTRTIRQDTDEFTYGTAASHSDGDDFVDGLTNSPHIVTVKHHGDLIFYETVEAEVRGSGILRNGHSAVLLRERGTSREVLARTWQPDLSGVGSHRSYTTAFIDECEPGDRYVSGILYPVTGTTLALSDFRVNSISQIMRVAPRVVV